MPLINKSVSGSGASNQAAVPEQGETLPPAVETITTAGAPGDHGDPEIIKSPSDPKEYRYIELSNGLRALLISDFSSAGTGSEDEEGEEVEEEEEETEDSDEGDIQELEDQDEEPGLKRKRSEKQAAAALCIGVGSFSDPDDLPGLAHFLEHMVFMGSEKYPAENDFDAFLKKHGGSNNAATDCERTVFQFDVQRKYFRDALHRWAQFFICPLMLEDAMDREVEAVDSEFQMARPSDFHRKEMLFGSLSKAGHPMGKFFWGNAQTLKHDPKERQIDTYQRLRDFWRRHYSAHYMTLAVQSRETLDTLEEWVRQIFIEVPNNGEPRPDFSHLQEPFDTPAFKKLYRVVPVRKVHAVTISWAVPPQGKHYRVKPLHYISWLVGHEGAGSILSLLRKRCWALALCGGNSKTGFEENTTYSIFSISITLTDGGFQNFFQVIHLVFQYLKMLQTLGPQERIYEEIQQIGDYEFQYQEQTDPIEFVENICENMQLFPKMDLLTGDQLMFEFDSQVIGSVLDLLTPQRANLLLLSPDNQGRCLLRERWFGTCFSCDDIPEKWSQRWAGNLELHPDFHLPDENRFIATDFALKESDCPDTEFPVRIVKNERGALWFKKDNTFKIPKAYIWFHLVSPLIQTSPESLVLFDLFINILAHNLAEPAYEANVAQLEYKLVAGEHGVVIRLRGFNHKLPLLLQLIVDHLAGFSSEPDVFAMFSEQLKKAYFNILIKHDRLGRDVRLQILEPKRWSGLQKYQVLINGLTNDNLMTFAADLKVELYAEGLVQGNFTSEESKEFLQYFTEKLQFQPLSAEVPVSFLVAKLPQKPLLCKVKSLNRGDANSEITVFYQSGLKRLREHALMELMVMLMEEPCFDFLRTKETLGYQVYPTFRNTSGVLGFSVTVETQATKFSTEFVEAKIEEFLQKFGKRLSSLTEEAFSTQVTSLIKLKECEDAHLGEEVERNWFEVVTQQYVFNRLNKEIEALKVFAKEELVSWFLEHRDNSRKLSVHVVGFGREENDPPDQSTDDPPTASVYGEVSELTFLPVLTAALQEATLITDIRGFTASLPLYPYHKILD
ncbi:nardilysin isoform X2 [Oryzias latipes]|uniref:nardilysin isoform X2 n=1 Tax=Oryzias latipes TaxID=8090 RepID=UPI0009DAFE46|nr:nardilysin isoform X2 [Oryzias latipes]